ncbi:MAG: RnfABCDGE type electron transport complex subunit B [Treponema sp.]|jgi:Na+-translocating ferredoxin:NAD+ oxidoreductase RNF subunit RnfB|nr:RnfABCDGE type electron transport complex subunit B [Treponema sp.]
MMIVIITAIFALVLAFILGTALGFFREFFAVPNDPLVDKIREVLPGANCGGCGYPGCDNYAAAVASGGAPVNACPVGGPSVAEKIASMLGVTGGAVVQTIAVLACQGSVIHAKSKGNYTGLETCRGAKLAGGTKLCSWGCIGFGDCVKVCKFGALSMSEKQLPKVDIKKCTGCNICVSECPQGILKAIPKDQKGAMVLCSNKSPVKGIPAKQCRIACIKCGLCVKNCPQQCISLGTEIPAVDMSKCTSCGTCVEKCPTKVIKIIERDIF